MAAIVRGFNADLPAGVTRSLDLQGDNQLVHRGRVVSGSNDMAIDDLLSLLYDVQIGVIEHDICGAWPRCPWHGTHPLRITDEGWKCEASEQLWQYGTLARHPLPPEPARVDGEVRWMMDSWGLIAHRDGDLWFRYSDGPLAEGQRVDFVEDDAMQGNLRRALNVSP